MVVPIGRGDAAKRITAAVEDLITDLTAGGVRAHLDDRPQLSPGFKFNHWEMLGTCLNSVDGQRGSSHHGSRRDRGVGGTVPDPAVTFSRPRAHSYPGEGELGRRAVGAFAKRRTRRHTRRTHEKSLRCWLGRDVLRPPLLLWRRDVQECWLPSMGV
ncbi:MAG: His/Gly/Thr/Pro-type tRNA ligase C-terminal domain-containing protein [Pseudonocardia sp.]